MIDKVTRHSYAKGLLRSDNLVQVGVCYTGYFQRKIKIFGGKIVQEISIVKSFT